VLLSQLEAGKDFCVTNVFMSLVQMGERWTKVLAHANAYLGTVVQHVQVAT